MRQNEQFFEDSWKELTNYTQGTSYKEKGYWRDRDIIKRNSIPDEDLEEFTKAVSNQINPKFTRLMDNRMIQGLFRYGRKQSQKGAYDYINGPGGVLARIRRYIDTHNLECLVDAGNLLRLEFDHPGDPLAYFDAVDDGIHNEISKPK
jgi:hypothetical protein